MPSTPEGLSYLKLQAGETLIVVADANSSGLVRRVTPSGGNLAGSQTTNVPASSTRIFGPFPLPRTLSFEVAQGSFVYSVITHDFGYAVDLGNVEGFTGNRTLNMNDNGKILRCDDSSAVTITIPNNLPEGFNVSFTQWGIGSVTIVAASGATARSTASAASGQYKVGCVAVIKNTGGTAAEYTVNGEVS